MKKKYEVTINNNLYIVELESEIAGVLPEKVTVNSREYTIDVNDIDKIESVLLNKISYSVHISRDDNDEISEIDIDGDSHSVNIVEHGIPKIKKSESSESTITVKSQIAGKVTDVKKSEGDTVEKDETVLIIEAMKMENEINSPLKGQLKEISVSKNSDINPGEQLFIVEP